VCRRPAQPGVQPQLDPPSHRLSEPRLRNQFEVQIARAVGPNIRKVSRRPYVAVQQIQRRTGGEELEVSPMGGMRPPQLPEQPVEVVGPEHLARLLKACEGR
jgi:hypothetical protein